MHLNSNIIMVQTWMSFDSADSQFGVFVGEARVYIIVWEFSQNKTIVLLRLGNVT